MPATLLGQMQSRMAMTSPVLPTPGATLSYTMPPLPTAANLRQPFDVAGAPMAQQPPSYAPALEFASMPAQNGIPSYTPPPVQPVSGIPGAQQLPSFIPPECLSVQTQGGFPSYTPPPMQPQMGMPGLQQLPSYVPVPECVSVQRQGGFPSYTPPPMQLVPGMPGVQQPPSYVPVPELAALHGQDSMRSYVPGAQQTRSHVSAPPELGVVQSQQPLAVTYGSSQTGAMTSQHARVVESALVMGYTGVPAVSYTVAPAGTYAPAVSCMGAPTLTNAGAPVTTYAPTVSHVEGAFTTCAPTVSYVGTTLAATSTPVGTYSGAPTLNYAENTTTYASASYAVASTTHPTAMYTTQPGGNYVIATAEGGAYEMVQKLAIAPGMFVEVLQEFVSDNRDPVTLQRGLCGQVVNIGEDGAALVEFAHVGEQWVLRHDFDKLMESGQPGNVVIGAEPSVVQNTHAPYGGGDYGMPEGAVMERVQPGVRGGRGAAVLHGQVLAKDAPWLPPPAHAGPGTAGVTLLGRVGSPPGAYALGGQ